MALGGGSFITQNKVIPGAYINFISKNSSILSMSDRGVASMALELDWGVDDQIFEVTLEDLQKDSLKIFGYEYTSDKLKGLRDLFKSVKKLYCYKLTTGGVKASNDYATAKYCGKRGNDLKIVIKNNVDQSSHYDVMTYLGSELVDTQTVNDKTQLLPNDYVEFKTTTLNLQEQTAGVPLSNGTNGTVNGASHQKYLEKIESYSFNVIGVLSTDDAIKNLYISFVKRLRDDVGSKFQVVMYSKAADYLGVINVKNKVKGDDAASLVYWVTGITAACPINKSNLNRKYDGEFEVEAEFTQTQLEQAILGGEFALHKVGDDIRVLNDINSFTTITDDVGDIYKDNQTIRIIDQFASEIQKIFITKYLGIAPNDKDTQISFWADVVKIFQEFRRMRAIEEFNPDDDIIVNRTGKKTIDVLTALTVIGTVEKLYMTVKVA